MFWRNNGLRSYAFICWVFPCLVVTIIGSSDGLADNNKLLELNDRALNHMIGYRFKESAKVLKQAEVLVASGAAKSKNQISRLEVLKGILLVTKEHDTFRGLHAFVSALKVKPSARIPADLATPQLAKIFSRAKSLLGQYKAPRQTNYGKNKIEIAQKKKTRVIKGLVHEPRTFIKRGVDRVFTARVGSDLTVGKVGCFVRGASSSEYTYVKMEKKGEEYRCTIPEELVKGKYLHYYLSVLNPRGQVLAVNGKAVSPNVVLIQ